MCYHSVLFEDGNYHKESHNPRLIPRPLQPEPKNKQVSKSFCRDICPAPVCSASDRLFCYQTLWLWIITSKQCAQLSQLWILKTSSSLKLLEYSYLGMQQNCDEKASLNCKTIQGQETLPGKLVSQKGETSYGGKIESQQSKLRSGHEEIQHQKSLRSRTWLPAPSTALKSRNGDRTQQWT